MFNKAKYVLLAVLALWGGRFISAQALTYASTNGAVLGTSTSFYPYPTGTLVDDSGTVYFISGTTKVPFTSWQAFIGLGYKATNIVNGDLTNYTPSFGYVINTANTTHPWGSWLIYQGTVYYSTQAGLIGVPSAQAFTSNGGDWTYIVKANSYDVTALNANPNLQPLAVNDPRITTTPTYSSGNTPTTANTTTSTGLLTMPGTGNSIRIGQLVTVNGTVFLVAQNGLYGFPDVNTFNSWGYSFSNVLPANIAEAALPVVGVINARLQGCTDPISQLNGTCTVTTTPTVGTPSITVTAPTSGAQLVAGQTYNITWNSTGVQTVKLNLCATSNTLGYTCIAMSGPSTNYNASLGSYSFYVDPNSPFVPGTGVKVRVTDIASGVYGESAPFSIVAAGLLNSSNPTISYITPTSGTAGQTVNIKIYGSGFLSVSNQSGDALPITSNLQLQTSRAVSDSEIDATYIIAANAPSSTYQFAVGSSNAVPFTIIGANATQTQLTFTLDPASPVAQTIAPDSKNVTFTVFDITASGGSGSLSSIGIGSDSLNGQTNLTNIRVYQGTTLLGTMASLSNTSSANGFAQAWNQVNFSSLTIPPTYSPTIFSVVADVSPSATGSTKLGIIGLGFGSTGAATTNLTQSFMAFGNLMTFSGTTSNATTLTASLNPAFTALTITQGTTGQRISSYVVDNTSSQSVSLNSMFFAIDSATYGGQSLFQNVVVKLNGTQFGQVLGTLNASIGAYTFNAATPVTITANTAFTVDIYADVPINASAPGYINTVTLLENCSGTGISTAYSGGCNVANGQSLTLAAPVSSTITLTPTFAVAISPLSQSVVGGTSNQPIATYNIMASGGSATIQELDFTIVGSTGTPITIVTVNGVNVAVAGTTAQVTGLSIVVAANYSGVNIPVSVNYPQVGPNGVPAGQKFTLNLAGIKYLDSSGVVHTLSPNLASNQMTLVASSN